MDIEKESRCITELDTLLKKHFDTQQYCLAGPRDSAVCMEKVTGGWNVFDGIRAARIKEKSFTNVVEASLEVINRLAGKSAASLKDEFFQTILR